MSQIPPSSPPAARPAPLPNDSDVERAVLSCALRQPDKNIPTILDAFGDNPGVFYIPSHQTLYAAIVGIWRVSGKIDVITLNAALNDAGEIDAVGGPAAVAELLDEVPTTALLNHYIEILRDKATRRGLITELDDVAVKALDPELALMELIEAAEEKIFDLRNFANREASKTGMRPAKAIMPEVVADLEHSYQNKGKTTRGLATGFPSFDRFTMGLAPATSTIVAARPSMGKTSLAMNIAENVALEIGHNVAVFTLEMSGAQLLKRSVSGRSGVPIYRLRDGCLTHNALPKLQTAAREISDSGRLFIDDTGGLSIQELRSRARRGKTQFNIDLIVIDYLQLMHSTSKQAQANRYREIGDISGGVKAMAKELDLPVITLAQLSRKVDERADGRPQLSDLREGGDIEQDADNVLLMFRPARVAELKARQQHHDQDPDFEPPPDNSAVCILAKQRDGPVGEFKLEFNKELVKFTDPSPELYDQR